MEVLSLVGGLIQILELGRRFMSEYYHTDNDYSFKTDVGEIITHLSLLRSTVEGTDMEVVVAQCAKHCEEISEALRSFQEANASKKASLSLYLRERLPPLRKQLPLLALKAVRGWYDLQAQGLPCHILEAYSGSYVGAHHLLGYINNFPLTDNAHWAHGPIILHLLTSNITASSRERWETELKHEILEEIYKGRVQLSSVPRPVDPVRENNIQQSFLRRLAFPGINGRKAEIPNALGSSFNWILDPSVDSRGDGTSFRRWLSDSQPLLWIKGKSGCGKSTLAGYLADSERFASNGTVVSFFFCSAGMHIQNSSLGLLRSLLLQILSQTPRIIPTVAPSRWEALLLFGEDPKPLDRLELEQMLISTLVRRQAKSKLLVIIDALDECPDSGEVFLLILRIAACPGVKICILSRPLSQLQDMIDSAPNLTLENCTMTDMEEFVTSEIETQLSLTPGPSISPSVKEKLVHELTCRASGCFLWVILVVRSLRRALVDEDKDILCLVKGLPTELNGIYRYFLDELDASQPFMASIVRFIAFSQKPISPLRLSFMEMNFPGFVLRQEISVLPRETLYLQTQKSIEKILSESKGLLEINRPGCCNTDRLADIRACDARVRVIHRSVRDFLEAEPALGASPWSCKSGYDLAARFCAASLSILKASTISDLTVHSISIEAFQCAYTAMFTHTENDENVMRILDELESTCCTLLKSTATLGEGLCFIYTCGPDWCRAPCDALMGQNKILPKLRRRATALCWKYILRLREEPNQVNHDFPNGGDFRQIYPRNAQRLNKIGVVRQNISSRRNTQLQATESIEGIDVADPDTNIEKLFARLGDSPLEIKEARSAPDESDLDPIDEDIDNDDNVSWESFSSIESSLDEAHPLMAFKAEVVQAVLQGFIKHRLDYVDGD